MDSFETQPHGEIIIKRKKFRVITGIPNSTYYDWADPKSPRHDPTLPRQIALGIKSRGFILSEVMA